MNLNNNWGVKQLHQLKFGIHTNSTEKHTVNHSVFARLTDQDLNKIPSDNKYLLVFGNIWANKHDKTVFHNPMNLRLVHKQRYVFWDNPALPHLLYKGPWNPEGYKNWCRMCWDHINPTPYTPAAHASGSERVNSLLAQASNGEITHWHQLIGGYPRDTKTNKTALLLPSSPEWHHYYQGINVADWVQQRKTLLEQRGYTVHVRSKPSRRDRESSAGKLYNKLDSVGLVVTEGVSAIESILAGTPALVGDWAPTGPLATRWDDFVLGQPIDTPTADRTEQWMERVLQDVFHKKEIYEGSWNGITRT